MLHFATLAHNYTCSVTPQTPISQSLQLNRKKIHTSLEYVALYIQIYIHEYIYEQQYIF